MRIRLLDASEYDGIEFEIPNSAREFFLPEPEVLGQRLEELLKNPNALTREPLRKRRYLRVARTKLTPRQMEETNDGQEVHVFIHEGLADRLLKGKA